MFGFGKRKRKDQWAELATVVSALAIFWAEKENRNNLCPFTEVNKQIICDELDRLQKDHWDKNAFDALKKFVKTL